MKFDFVGNLKSIMEIHDISQEELADRIGSTPAAVSQYLSGKREPGFYTILTICRELDVKPNGLLLKKERK